MIHGHVTPCRHQFALFGRIEVVNQLDAGAVFHIIKNYTVDYDKTWIYEK